MQFRPNPANQPWLRKQSCPIYFRPSDRWVQWRGPCCALLRRLQRGRRMYVWKARMWQCWQLCAVANRSVDSQRSSGWSIHRYRPGKRGPVNREGWRLLRLARRQNSQEFQPSWASPSDFLQTHLSDQLPWLTAILVRWSHVHIYPFLIKHHSRKSQKIIPDCSHPRHTLSSKNKSPKDSKNTWTASFHRLFFFFFGTSILPTSHLCNLSDILILLALNM